MNRLILLLKSIQPNFTIGQINKEKEPNMNNTDSNKITREYFDSILVESRYIDSDLPSTDINLYGETFSTPIMTAALSHLHDICPNGMSEFAKGAKDANTLHWVGMGEDKELEDIVATGAKTVKIIKPHYDNKEVFRKIEHARKSGVIAMGMDIDHCFSGNGSYDIVCGLPMKSKSFEEIKEFIAAAEVPFIIKGVLSPIEAEKCINAGAKGIVVSHHHGILPSAVPPLMILPEIVKVVNKQIPVFVDCGIESGLDAFKALALGADAVSVGRALMGPLKESAPGVTSKINDLNNELKSIMARTGAHSLNEIDSSVLHFRNF